MIGAICFLGHVWLSTVVASVWVKFGFPFMHLCSMHVLLARVRSRFRMAFIIDVRIIGLVDINGAVFV